MYAQHGPDGMSQEAFRDYWREHFEVSEETPGFWTHVRRYVQGDALNALPVDLGQSGQYHGVAEIYYDGLDARNSALTAPGVAEKMVPHALQFFGASPPVRLSGEETQFIARQEDGVKAFTFFRRNPALDAGAFAAKLKQAGEALVGRAGVAALLTGYSQTIACEDGVYDAVDEIGCATIEDLEVVLKALASNGVMRADQRDYADCDARLMVIVAPNLLFDGLAQAA